MTCGLATALEPPHFNHAPVWGATRSAPGKRTGETRFNPRTRVGCDAFRQVGTKSLTGFNPRTRVGCDSAIFYSLMGFNTFQSTHPRGVRQQLITGQILIILVSIHAPAWGATSPVLEKASSLIVSIHAPAWGATPRLRRSFGPSRCFNPRTRVGCDACDVSGSDAPTTFQSTHPRGVRLQNNRPLDVVGHVSIHAPAWGATGILIGLGHIALVSIHAPAWGATSRKVITTPRRGEFQSTHPRGVRLMHGQFFPGEAFVSIHAPAWGATRCHAHQPLPSFLCFNPRTRVGCDHGTAPALCPDPGFNPRTRVGCDGCLLNSETTVREFQSTHPRGVRHRPV